MSPTFACPECGTEIRVEGLTPGRTVRCQWCTSWVEVPFLPRVPVKRTRGSRLRKTNRVKGWWKRNPRWARLSISTLTVLVILALGNRYVRDRRESADCAALGRLIESSDRAEKAGDLGMALVDVEAALALISRMPPDLSRSEFDGLKQRRAELSLREVQNKLAALNRDASATPASADAAGRAVGYALGLNARLARDPALAGLGPLVDATLERLRERWAVADGVEARKAFLDNQPTRTLELSERQYRTAEELPSAARERLRREATETARDVISRYGAVVNRVRGKYTLGSDDSYNGQLGPVIREALRKRGYLPMPVKAEWADLWASLAPFRVAFEINERQDDHYLASPNRLSVIEGRLGVTRQGTPVWSDRPNARTTVPLPGLSAYAGSRIAAGERRSPDFERLLYENARANLRDRLALSLRNFPLYKASGGLSTE